MVKRKKTLLITFGLVSFVLLVFSILYYYNYQKENYRKIGENYLNLNHMNMQEMHKMMMEESERRSKESTLYLIPISLLGGILIGGIVYYFMEEEVESKKEQLKGNTETILRLLNKEERIIIKKLLENKGEMRQYEISYIAGLNKVKTHRLIRALEKKGIIQKEKFGKVNKIKLNEDIYEVLKG